MTKRKQATSDLAIRSAKPESKPYKMGAGLGMYLLVTPKGSKLWRLKYRFDGKEKTLSFGPYPEINLAAARKKREEARELIANGIDPMAAKREEKAEALKRTLSFGEVAERWYKAHSEHAIKPWAMGTAKKVRLYLDKDILPSFGNRPIAEITRRDLVLFNEEIEKRGALEPAAKIRRWLDQIFQGAYEREEVAVNPAYRLTTSHYAKGASSKHHPTVDFLEIPALLKAVDSTNTSKSNKLAIRVLLYTAVRPGELRLATWDEFNLNAGIWAIPAERMKTRKEHIVPLSTLAVSALKELQNLSGNSQLVLPNRNGLKPISDATINRVFKMAGYHRRQTGHGFRHLLSTELNERGYNPDWIEAQLSHRTTESDRKAGRSTHRQTYNHAIYLEQRKTMMQEWAENISEAIDSYNKKNS